MLQFFRLINAIEINDDKVNLLVGPKFTGTYYNLNKLLKKCFAENPHLLNYFEKPYLHDGQPYLQLTAEGQRKILSLKDFIEVFGEEYLPNKFQHPLDVSINNIPSSMPPNDNTSTATSALTNQASTEEESTEELNVGATIAEDNSPEDKSDEDNTQWIKLLRAKKLLKGMEFNGNKATLIFNEKYQANYKNINLSLYYFIYRNKNVSTYMSMPYKSTEKQPTLNLTSEGKERIRSLNDFLALFKLEKKARFNTLRLLRSGDLLEGELITFKNSKVLLNINAKYRKHYGNINKSLQTYYRITSELTEHFEPPLTGDHRPYLKFKKTTGETKPSKEAILKMLQYKEENKIFPFLMLVKGDKLIKDIVIDDDNVVLIISEEHRSTMSQIKWNLTSYYHNSSKLSSSFMLPEISKDGYSIVLPLKEVSDKDKTVTTLTKKKMLSLLKSECRTPKKVRDPISLQGFEQESTFGEQDESKETEQPVTIAEELPEHVNTQNSFTPGYSNTLQKMSIDYLTTNAVSDRKNEEEEAIYPTVILSRSNQAI